MTGTFEGMLPNAIDSPAKAPESLSDFQVTLFVSRDFPIPIIQPALRHSTVGTAPVPETAVNEYSQTLAAEHEIRFAR